MHNISTGQLKCAYKSTLQKKEQIRKTVYFFFHLGIHSVLKCLKMSKLFVLYFVELCTKALRGKLENVLLKCQAE